MLLLWNSNKVWRILYVTDDWSMYIFRQNKSILQELWIFFACIMTLRKCVYNYSDLENCMSMVCRTSNATVMWLKIFDLLYWIDWYILQAYLWKYMEPFIHDQHAEYKIHADWKQPTLKNRQQNLPTLLNGYKYRTKGIYF